VTLPPPTQPPVTNPPPTNPPVTVKPGGSGNSTPATAPAQNGGDNGSGGPSGGTPRVTTADGVVVAPPVTLPDGSPAPTVALTSEQKAKAKAAAKADKAKAKSDAKTKANADAAKESDAETDESDVAQSGDAVVERTALGAPVDGSGESGSPVPAALAVFLIAALVGGSFFVIRKRRLQSS
jgi:hypothetical protein